MNWLIRALRSSIGKKLIMGLTGLGLCGFLIVHLAGNLLLYVGSESYNLYAHTLHAQKVLLPIAEVGLLLMFVLHIVLAIDTTRQNRAARETEYHVNKTKLPGGLLNAKAESFAHSTMMLSGLVVLAFIIVHLAHFRYEQFVPGLEGKEPFEKAVLILSGPFTWTVYGLGSVVLALHLSHGFQSAFQSLGINHPKFTPWIKHLGFWFALVIGLGFASFPFWAVLR